MPPTKRSTKQRHPANSLNETLCEEIMEEELTIKDLYVKLLQIEDKLKKIDAIEKQMTELKTSQEFISMKYEEQKQEIIDLKKSNESIRNENKKLSHSINLLMQEIQDTNAEINNLEQYGRREMVEIVGIPHSDNENTDEIVGKLCEQSNVEINIEKDIEVSHRISTKPTSAIIVKFNSRRKRDEFNTKGRKASLNADNIGFTESKRIYVNESLTYSNRTVFKKTKDKLKNNFKYIWLKNGITLIKKDDHSKIHKILFEEDINRYVSQ